MSPRAFERLFNMMFDGIDQVYLIPFPSQPKRMHASAATHIQNRSRRLGKIALENILRSDAFQLSGALKQAACLVDLGIVA